METAMPCTLHTVHTTTRCLPIDYKSRSALCLITSLNGVLCAAPKWIMCSYCRNRFRYFAERPSCVRPKWHLIVSKRKIYLMLSPYLMQRQFIITNKVATKFAMHAISPFMIYRQSWCRVKVHFGKCETTKLLKTNFISQRTEHRREGEVNNNGGQRQQRQQQQQQWQQSQFPMTNVTFLALSWAYFAGASMSCCTTLIMR